MNLDNKHIGNLIHFCRSPLDMMISFKMYGDYNIIVDDTFESDTTTPAYKEFVTICRQIFTTDLNVRLNFIHPYKSENLKKVTNVEIFFDKKWEIEICDYPDKETAEQQAYVYIISNFQHKLRYKNKNEIKNNENILKKYLYQYNEVKDCFKFKHTTFENANVYNNGYITIDDFSYTLSGFLRHFSSLKNKPEYKAYRRKNVINFV